ncbi:MAG: hypothetical protein SFV22_09150 [Saprospiraceae bacterium]|nr:hypothetical protein [Saprospiraceae bacterium]
MTILGYVFLSIATLLYLIAFSSLFVKSPPSGGDAVAGYAWMILFFNLAFFICMILVATAIYRTGGFDWVSPNGSTRLFLVCFGVIAGCFTASLSMLLKEEPGIGGGALRPLFSTLGVIIPASMLIAGWLLLIAMMRAPNPPDAFKVPAQGVFILGVTGVVAFFIGWMRQSALNQQHKIADALAFQEKNRQRILQDIEKCDVSKDMVFIFVFTDANQSAEVRDKALAKIKSNPDWQQELIRRLQNDWAPEAFTFLASNEVEDKKIFLEPIREGVFIQANLIRKSIRNSTHPSHFYPERFNWEVERVIRTIERFNGMGVDYAPALRELRAALNEPTQFDAPVYKCLAPLDHWLKQHH